MAKYIVTANKLNKRVIIPSNLPDLNNIAGIVNKGYTFDAQEVDPKTIPNLSLGKWYKGNDNYYYWGGGISLIHAGFVMPPTLQQIFSASGASAETAQKFLPYLIDTLNKYSIITAIRILCFLAQTGEESDGLYATAEYASGAEYEGRKSLGNTNTGDGPRYKGRGLIQVTGRGNYQWISNSFGVDFINNPELLGAKNVKECSADQLKYAALSAGWYWNNHELNTIADQIDINNPIDEGSNYDNFKRITLRINGGYNGLDKRLENYKAGLPYFT